jgi:hypothetical protein
MAIFKHIFKYIILALSIFGIFGFAELIVRDFPLIFNHLRELLAIGIGILSFTILWSFFLYKRGHFWSTLEHELTHALFAVLFFKKIHSISASRRKGGMISIESGNAVIALAPYIFPLTPSIVLIFLFILPAEFQFYIFFLLGFAYQFHLMNLVQEFHLGQSDLQKSGIVFSVIIILFANLVYFGLLLSALEGKFSSFYQFIWDGFILSVNYMSLFFSFFRNELINVITR